MADGEDGDLLRAVAAGDQAALLALYDRYARLAFALAYRVLGDGPSAEEVVQDAFLQVWRRAGAFDPGRGSNARAWLLTIVRHRAIDLRRRAASRSSRDVALEAVEPVLAGPDPWDEVLATLERDRVRAAVTDLPAEQRQAIELAYYEGLTQREIAERTGLPLGTVKGRLRLGLQKLAAALGVVGRAAEGGR